MIPNIVKGRGITGALAYALGQGNDPQTGERKELLTGEKSRAEILGGQNFGFEIDSPERLEVARRMMEWQGLPENQASRTKKAERDCLHASLSWADGQNPSREEMIDAAQSFLKSLGMENARAVFIAHDDTDHKHLHIVASVIDPETRRAIPLHNDFIKGQKWAAEWDRQHGQEQQAGRQLPALIDAVQKRDADAVLSFLTRDKATFQVWEVDRALVYGGMKRGANEEFRNAILARPNVVGLRESADSPIERYTTREVLAAEMALQRSADHLAENKRHGIERAQLDRVEHDFTLKREQANALRHLTGSEGFAMLWGEAGTGKSHTLKAVRATYEAAGHSVIGMAWTNDVAQQMVGDGFKRAATIASELYAYDKGRSDWNSKTVLIVDEAAMISTDNLARVALAAERSGAKLILAGDDRQLASIERGGMFETLRQTHGAATLKDVQRVQEADQKAAFNGMHAGDFREALQTFDRAGGIHWTTRQSDTLREMAERYTADVYGATPAEADKRRFMFALTNKDVIKLNEHARALHRAHGDLGPDHTLNTRHGEAQFAGGGRIQFTGNGRTKAEKNAGLVNGRVGTVVEIDDSAGKPRLTVELDGKRGEDPQRVSFTVGDNAKAGEFDQFKYGYAGTIYRGQGRTLDEVYVAHSAQWRASASYVALTRHREAVHIFAARETVKDLDAMAAGMARADNKRAALAYAIDAAELTRVEQAIEQIASRHPERAPDIEATETSETPTAGIAEDRNISDVIQGAEHVAEGAAKVLDGAADIAEKAIEVLAEGLASILGGGLSTPPPEQSPTQQEPKVEPKHPMTRAEKMAAFRDSERAQREAHVQEIRQQIASGQSISQEDIARLQGEDQARAKTRDRGGGQSL